PSYKMNDYYVYFKITTIHWYYTKQTLFSERYYENPSYKMNDYYVYLKINTIHWYYTKQILFGDIYYENLSYKMNDYYLYFNIKINIYSYKFIIKILTKKLMIIICILRLTQYTGIIPSKFYSASVIMKIPATK